MMHSARENTINPNDDKIKQLRAHGSKMISAAMDKINLILARYNERVKELAAAQTKQAQPIQKPSVAKPVATQVNLPRQMEKPAVARTPTPQTAPKPDNRAAFNVAKQRLEQHSAQAKLVMQQNLKIWIIGQKYQNAA